MKVHELLVEETLDTYARRLVSTLNIKRLGSGANAHVFQHPEFKNVVVKVFTNKDTVYRKYVAWCQKNQSNRYAPQIIQVSKFISPTGDKYNIVFMQKMRPMGEVTFQTWLLKTFGTTAVRANAAQNYYNLYRAMNKAIKASSDSDLKSIWAHILSYGLDHFDIHQGNVMMRGSQVVFSDPVGNAPSIRMDDQAKTF